jgi:hypothetical protein
LLQLSLEARFLFNGACPRIPDNHLTLRFIEASAVMGLSNAKTQNRLIGMVCKA